MFGKPSGDPLLECALQVSLAAGFSPVTKIAID
jgi:hypothetical protein